MDGLKEYVGTVGIMNLIPPHTYPIPIFLKIWCERTQQNLCGYSLRSNHLTTVTMNTQTDEKLPEPFSTHTSEQVFKAPRPFFSADEEPNCLKR
jgi:hypothetical protein